MNERIRELAEQAGITTNIDTDYFEKNINRWVDYYSEKFAKLIIDECCDLFEGVYTDQQRPERIDRRIKQHFGVEE
jgi:hypothetical protein